jgi:hypothetical protein
MAFAAAGIGVALWCVRAMAASSAAGCSKRGSQDASNYADLLLSTLYLYGCSYNKLRNNVQHGL